VEVLLHIVSMYQRFRIIELFFDVEIKGLLTVEFLLHMLRDYLYDTRYTAKAPVMLQTSLEIDLQFNSTGIE
jgi:hypothetical protein